MPFHLLAKETVEDGIKRIVSEEIARAIKDIDNRRLKRTEAIHEVRKSCKKIRAVLRLVRPQFEETYQFENAWFRDTAKGLAELRDAEAQHDPDVEESRRDGKEACHAPRRRSRNRDLR